MRAKRPEAGQVVDDFYQALAFPHTFDWNRQTPRWRAAMRELAREHQVTHFRLLRALVEKKLL